MWPNGTVADLAARTHRFLVTRGKDGADEWRGPLMQRIPVYPVSACWGGEGGGVGGCGQQACAVLAGWLGNLLAPWLLIRAVHLPRPACSALVCMSPTFALPLHLQIDTVMDTNGAGDTFATGARRAVCCHCRRTAAALFRPAPALPHSHPPPASAFLPRPPGYALQPT